MHHHHFRPNPYNHPVHNVGHHPYSHCHRDLKSSTYVEEPAKVAEIHDSYRNLRYKVVLETVPTEMNEFSDIKYVISVINCFSDVDETIILQIPSKGQPDILSYDHANHEYQDCIERYRLLVQAETGDIRDMNIYKHKTGYNVTKPECCETCKWCNVHRSSLDYVVGVTGHLECHNPANSEIYDFNHDRHREYDYNRRTYANAYDPRPKTLDIYPIVEPFGKCPHYKARVETLRPVPGESLTDILDHRMNSKFNREWIPALEAETERAVAVENEMSVKVDALSANSMTSADFAMLDEKIMSTSAVLESKLDQTTACIELSVNTLSTAVKTLNAELASEITARIDNETQLASKLDQTTATLSEKIEAETSNLAQQMTTGLAGISTKLDTETSKIMSNISNVQKTLDDEISRAQTTETAMMSTIAENYSELSEMNEMNALSITSANSAISTLSIGYETHSSTLASHSESIASCSTEIGNSYAVINNSISSLSNAVDSRFGDISTIISVDLSGIVPTIISNEYVTILSTTVSTIISNSISTIIIPNISSIIQDQVMNHMPIIEGTGDLTSQQLLGVARSVIMMSEGA